MLEKRGAYLHFHEDFEMVLDFRAHLFLNYLPNDSSLFLLRTR
jgi:hypothetical protein